MITENFIKEYEPRFHGFHDLMPFHVREVLLVSSLYDSFILEEDGQLSEHLFADYFDLDLSHAPRITQVSTGEKALKVITQRPFDLIITMMRLSDMDVNTFGKRIKEIQPNLPIILLAYESDINSHTLTTSDQSDIDNIFIWSGDTKILLTIIKLVEDHKNALHDIKLGNVRVIIIVEDSRRYYSLFLPLIYTEIMKQTQSLIAEGLNEMHRQLRRRARPKILLAKNFEEGMELYQCYQDNVLGIISDISYSRKGVKDTDAGFKFAQQIKEKNSELPLLLMSSAKENAQKAFNIGTSFLDKNSDHLLHDLRQFLLDYLGFGDFIFKLPNGREVGRASTLRKMQEMLSHIPDESIENHVSKNHFSNWLIARTEFTCAKKLRPAKISDFSDTNGLRQYLLNSILELRESKQRGVIVEFSRRRFDASNAFTRFSSGSLGGKARGIAFINALLYKNKIRKQFPDVKIIVPKTAVIGTNNFDQFLDINTLRALTIKNKDDGFIAKHFLNGRLPHRLTSDLRFFLEHVHYPLAIRSSSLLEDSQFQPFAGLYYTYMLPNNSKDIKVRLTQLITAIKLIYASTFFKAPKAYITALSKSIEEEKMAVIIQQLAGQKFGNYFYPNFSGIVQSQNFYPISYQKSEDGVALVALGLGKMVMEGGKVLRFSPRYPNILPNFSSPDEILEHSQRDFYALNLSNPNVKLSTDEMITLIKNDLAHAEKDGTLSPIGSVYSHNNNKIYDGIHHAGPRVVTFAHILKSKIFPLSDILSEILKIGSNGMGCPVQIEFAVNLNEKSTQKPEFYVLQIRPMISGNEQAHVSLNDINKKSIICQASNALGNGIYSDITDIIYIKPENFKASYTKQIADQIAQVNQEIKKTGNKYLLIGPGRWGTSDPSLGIPVTWDQISSASVMVETELDGFLIEPSQGTHFFHNITSFHIGYFSLKISKDDDFIDWNWLSKQTIVSETNFIRHIKLADPILIKINGRLQRGVIVKR